METQEIWKDIPGYEGKYQVSNLGDIKSSAKTGSGGHNGKILKKSNFLGYNTIDLSFNGTHKTHRVHRLVSKAFIPNPENKPQINHINGIKNDNRVENLEWCTASENGLHKFRVLGYKSKGGINPRFGKDNINSKSVNQYDLQGNFIKTWDSMMDVERELGILQCNISNCCRLVKYKSTGGFKWKFKI